MYVVQMPLKLLWMQFKANSAAVPAHLCQNQTRQKARFNANQLFQLPFPTNLNSLT